MSSPWRDRVRCGCFFVSLCVPYVVTNDVSFQGYGCMHGLVACKPAIELLDYEHLQASLVSPCHTWWAAGQKMCVCVCPWAAEVRCIDVHLHIHVS